MQALAWIGQGACFEKNVFLTKYLTNTHLQADILARCCSELVLHRVVFRSICGRREVLCGKIREAHVRAYRSGLRGLLPSDASVQSCHHAMRHTQAIGRLSSSFQWRPRPSAAQYGA